MAIALCTTHSRRLHDREMPWVLRHVVIAGDELVLIDREALPVAHLGQCVASQHRYKKGIPLNRYEVSIPTHEECPVCHEPEMLIERMVWFGHTRAEGDRAFAILEACLREGSVIP